MFDNRPFPSGDRYITELEDISHFLDVHGSMTTFRTRLNDLNMLSEEWLAAQPSSGKAKKCQDDDSHEEFYENDTAPSDDEDGIDDPMAPNPMHPENPFAAINFKNQMSILQFKSILKPFLHDFTKGTTREVRDLIFATCTAKEKNVLENYLNRVPNGILIIKGAAGVGKTAFSTRVLHIQVAGGKRVLVTASANQAVNDISTCRHPQLLNEEYLFFRFWAERLEFDIIKSCDPTNVEATVEKMSKKKPSNIGYDIDFSLANAVLKLAGLRQTKNAKILELRKHHTRFFEVLNKEVKKRAKEEWAELNGLVSTAMKALIGAADMVFTTATVAGSKMMRRFVLACDAVFVNEGACVTEL